MNEDGTKATDDDQEFLLDEQGNIYDLSGNFVATMGNDDDESQKSNALNASQISLSNQGDNQ